MQRLAPVIILFAFFASCKRAKLHADFIVKNAKVYTVDGGNAVLQSFAIRGGKFVAIGTDSSISMIYDADSTFDAGGKTILPGLIDAHCHFVGYGLGLQQCDLVGTKSFDEVIAKVKEFAKTNKLPWIIGRGWDQNDWANKNFPTRWKLDSLFPNTPVILKRVDGHAALVNKAALAKANIHYATKIPGGEVITTVPKDDRHIPEDFDYDNLVTGVLVDNAVDLVEKIIPQPDFSTMREALLQAQQNCFAVGLTMRD